MASTIDPFAELEQFLPKRTVSTIRMLFSGDSPLSPGQKVCLSAACSALGRDGNATGLADIVALKGDKKIAQGLLPKAKSPQAWRVPLPAVRPSTTAPASHQVN